MLTFSDYILEQELADYPDILDEGFWELMGRLTSKSIPREQMEKEVLKVKQLRDPKKIANKLNPSNPIHITHAAANHPLLPPDAIISGATDNRHHISINKILNRRKETIPQPA